MSQLLWWYWRWATGGVPPAPGAPRLCTEAHLGTQFTADRSEQLAAHINTTLQAEICACPL